MSDSGTAALKSESQNRPPPPPPKDDPSRGSASKAAPTAPAKTLPTRGPATPPRPSVAPRRIPSGRALSLSPERPADKPRPAATNATKSRLPPPTVVTSTAKPPLVPSDKPVFDPAILSDASASPDDEDRLALDYLAELGKASGPLPGRRGSSGPPSPWTPHESGPSAGTATVGELQKTEMVASPPGSPVPSGTPSRDELGQPVQDKIYPDTGGVERLAEVRLVASQLPFANRLTPSGFPFSSTWTTFWQPCISLGSKSNPAWPKGRH